VGDRRRGEGRDEHKRKEEDPDRKIGEGKEVRGGEQGEVLSSFLHSALFLFHRSFPSLPLSVFSSTVFLLQLFFPSLSSFSFFSRFFVQFFFFLLLLCSYPSLKSFFFSFFRASSLFFSPFHIPRVGGGPPSSYSTQDGSVRVSGRGGRGEKHAYGKSGRDWGKGKVEMRRIRGEGKERTEMEGK